MPKVKNLTIKLQSGSDSTHYASWEYDPMTKVPAPGGSGNVKVGSWVKVKKGAKWYNGVSIASFIFNDTWKVYELSGTRAVINQNKSGTNRIMSPIHVNNLTPATRSIETRASTSIDTLDHYEVQWYYSTGDGIWFSNGSSTDTKNKYSTYSAPSNATSIKIKVKPVAKKRKVNGKDTAYWTGTSVSATYSLSVNPPEVPPSPSVEIEDYDLTATVDNVSDPRSDEIQFEVYNLTTRFSVGIGSVKACMASYKCKVNAGGEYRVRARSINLVSGKKVYSDWTDFTDIQITIPSPPAGFTTIRGSSSTSVYLEWPAVTSAETYDIEYTTKLNYFDNSSETTTVSGIEFTHYEVTGLETGNEYFFRVRAVNEKGESAWSEIKSVVIGKKPSAPTTWSSSTTVVTGDPLTLYWVHNAEDASTETFAEIEFTIGDRTWTEIIKNEGWDDPENEDKDKTKSYKVDTSEYTEGTKIKWRVRTAGITKQLGDYSIMRTVDIYAPPTLELHLTNQNGDAINVLNEFPLFLKGLAGPNTQMPIGYHVTVTANTGYETVDDIGRRKIVAAGEAVYSQYIDTNDPLLIEFSPANIDLENNVTYTVTVVVSMNSGLTKAEIIEFSVSWSDDIYDLNTEIAIDEMNYVAYVTPYCRDENGEPVPDITLSVYRREFDGTFTEIAKGLDSTMNTVVTDPHPSLDYARYRIIAITNSTGAVSFYDAPAYPVSGSAVIIQWDEEWSDFDVTTYDVAAEPQYTGSMLKLPYNIDVADNNTPEATLVKYVGRTYPVSYYGTQIDSSSTWNVVIPKSDVETIYALRRLAIWKGDVYVREPSGTGYWANVTVSFSLKHVELTVPVTINITRVAGGM